MREAILREDRQLQHFIDVLERAIFDRLDEGMTEWNVADGIFSALKVPGAPGSGLTAASLPAQQHLATALTVGKSGPADVAAVAEAFGQLAPRLAWYRRKNAEQAGQHFMDGHANAIIIGEAGLERRSDLHIGASLMAPHVQYVDHHHPPAEIYLVMSPGSWRQEQRPWHEPGIGGIVYNTPHIVHAMKSAAQPLFAIWCLLVK
ncbi:MAG TPA: dimethylsulfonioproprionate lyase family protein [Dongiaceae bacterium]|nr:dimethylsulfonioproprionate lyase family protein [Dongiaceae bacterium]